MNDKIIKKTQDTLGKIIKKPPLTEKLLNKPPFRFLHDIITSVIKVTGFMKGLYKDDELNSENVKDKESKIAFLQKAIDMISMVNGKAVSARPSKIVAGHEPEKTNEFLQALASAINKKVDNDEYVQKVLGGDSNTSTKKDRDASADKRKKKDKEVSKSSRNSTNKDDKKENDEKERKHRRDKEKEKGDRERSRDRERSKDRGKDKDKKHRDKDKERSHDKDDKERGRERDRDRRKPSSSPARLKPPIMPSLKGPSKQAKASGLPRAPGLPKTTSFPKPAPRGRSEKPGPAKRPGKDATDKSSKKDKATKLSKQGTVQSEKRRPLMRNKTLTVRKEKEEDKENKEFRMMNGDAEEEEDLPARIPRPSSAKGSRRRSRVGQGEQISEEEKNREEEDQLRQEREREERRRKKDESPMNGPNQDAAPQQQNRRLARPSSARPAPPRIKKNEVVVEEQHIIGSSNVPNLIVDKNDDSDSEDDGFIAKEDDIPSPTNDEEPTPVDADEEGAEHGGLVKRILESKKELEGGSQQANKPMKKTEIERAGMNDATQRKHREMVQAEIDKLRGTIQTLTRSANPLGKIMDFVQEDLDQMQKELEMWKQEHRENSIALQREQSITESSIEPLKTQLQELDSQIADQMDIIAAVKCNILRNDDKIEKMLSTITKS